MRTKLNVLFFLQFFCLVGFSQSLIDSARQANIQNYYALALKYKNGDGVKIDFPRAYNYFIQAADLADAQSIYAIAYMRYKGLGCVQNYEMAATLFSQGAFQGRENSMYFYALCLRNGYGVAKNEDSAKYWLHKADSIGYKQAALELKMIKAENGNDSAKVLVQQISNAAIPDNTPLNNFTKILRGQPTREMVAGQYIGWIVQYDWSGQNVVNAKKMLLSVSNNARKFKGVWIEESDTAKLDAELNSTILKFTNTQYKRKDHYSPDSAIQYNFQEASLNMVQKNDSLFLAGNISMFSPDRKEPSKPLFVALSRKLEPLNLTEASLKANPNPFNDVLNVYFRLAKTTNVEVQLLSLNGSVVYKNRAGELQPGDYQLPLQPEFITSGPYFLKFIYGEKSSVIKIVKQ